MAALTRKVTACAAIALAFAVTAQAQNNRSFVATAGNDANNCSASAYCRTFTRALAVTNSGGEIVVVDSGGYGPATITQPVVITAIGVDASITAGSGNSQDALIINTPGNVTITGLSLYGGTQGGIGIDVQQVGFLRLYNIQIENFESYGLVTGSGKLALYNSRITNCYGGLYMFNSAQAYVDNTSFDHNQGEGAGAETGAALTIANSSAQYNVGGFAADGGSVTLYNDEISFNEFGLSVSGTTDIAGAGQLYFVDCLVHDNTFVSYMVNAGGTLSGSSPGTTMITPGQGTSGGGALSSGIALQ